jgi:hypothetical protein
VLQIGGMARNPRISAVITRPIAEFLKRKADELGISEGEYVRRTLDQHRLATEAGEREEARANAAVARPERPHAAPRRRT